ncbi:MAG: hypothetical protein A2698_02200 [Candidatus Levybacteria bacterium RIFCSPHIGHO2_01_FULL_42_15]|nr:MAG: hypothetical protein A2698_02200 [Candidatus Levybacteria bacterium RIFCSPHIGHO2_01_FULL_42_15]OGH43113.1 MAG: hypothetical protein A3B53_02895 [Candidatus Levybacteria bacterium RIFCSPLOWO2_01_FULL_42_15]
MVNPVERGETQDPLVAYQRRFATFLVSRGLGSGILAQNAVVNELKRAGQSARIEWTGDEEDGAPKLPSSVETIIQGVYKGTGDYVVESVNFFDKASSVTIAPTETDRLINGGEFVAYPDGLLVSTNLTFDLTRKEVWVGTLDPEKPRYKITPNGLEDSLQHQLFPFNGAVVEELSKLVQDLQTRKTGTRVIIEPLG